MDEKGEALKSLFMNFPGIGPRQAERFVYFLLRADNAYKKELAESISHLMQARRCPLCGKYFLDGSQERLCKICADDSRDKSTLMLIEKESEIEKVEKSGVYGGLYLLSYGLLSPMHEQSKHEKFIKYIKKSLESREGLKEIIIAFSATLEGEYSGNYIVQELGEYLNLKGIKLSFLGRGLSSGSELEYADSETIKHALKNRSDVKKR